MLKLKEIKKDYITSSETVHALRGVSVSFRQCEFVSILGPSGCGKTTLLNIIGGLDHYTDGDLRIGGVSTKSYTDRDWDVYRNHRIGFIFQSYNLIPHQTVLGNVELALTISGYSKEERIAKAKLALDRVGLSGQYYKRPNQLSGGQCQRVAIARALVNDPEILLADEPTGALDTVTSVQIMDLIKEISGERLVIMVTHNPEIAEQYSSRIIRLLDGEIVEDTDPFTEEEEENECQALAKIEEEKLERELADIPSEKEKKKHKKKRREKAKMSLFTAFRLSARNLLSKKGRTSLVGFAGSIGIIGIAFVLAFSAGIKGYVASMQDDMLSGNPITITEQAFDLNALTGMMNAGSTEEIEKEEGKIYVSSLIEYMIGMSSSLESMAVKNDIRPEYIQYIKDMPKEYYNAILLEYGIDLAPTLYTEIKPSEGADGRVLSIKAITDIYTSMLKETEYEKYATLIDTLAPSIEQIPNDREFLLSQYEIVAGSFPEGKNEIVLVLNADDELADILLARYGFYNQDEFYELIKRATAEEENKDSSYNKDIYRDSFEYDKLLGKTFTWYPNNSVFTDKANASFMEMPFTYNYDAAAFGENAGGVELRVAGILTTKENINYGSVQSGIYYTEELTQHILAANKDSNVTKYFADEKSYTLYTEYEYNYLSPVSGTEKTDKNYVGFKFDANSDGGMGNLMAMLGGGDVKGSLVRAFGGNDLANKISIYPVSFDEKAHVTDWLDAWNNHDAEADGDFTYTLNAGTDEEKTVTVAKELVVKTTYTDALELIISMINTMIDVITYALIAFTSVSLVVSTVMIGIITYVSVVERIKEIGVIRSLGGRKKDVSHLFNAESFIIGSLAGIIGVAVTYLISLIVNPLLAPVIGYFGIAALPVWQAALLILLSIGLTMISGIIPARSAARKDPVIALRTE